MKPGTRERLTSDLFLILAAAIWGLGFVAQRLATRHLSFFGFNAIRFLLGGLVLLPFVLKGFGSLRKTYGWVLAAGFVLFLASTLQQAGMASTTAGAAGFITGIYVVLVPVFLALFWRRKTTIVTWIAVAASFFGTWLLSTGGKMEALSAGNLLILGGAFLWALHVIVVGLAVQRMDAFAFSACQFLLAGSLHLLMSFLFGPLTSAAIRLAWLPLVYASLFSVVLGFTFQALGQRKAPASDAALLLSLESVFAALSGAVFLTETMSALQWLGCAIILAAVLFAQLAGSSPSVPRETVLSE